MGVSQTRRNQGVDNTLAPNGGVSITNTSEEPCNIHGLQVDVMIGNTGAGLTFGYWAIYLLPRGSTGVPTLTTTNLNNEQDSPVTWMLGTWMTTDTGVVSHIGGSPRTSRNCPRGGRLILRITSSVLSASSVRIHGVMTWFETIK